ncbi:MAG: GNAT family N-acetyltransferase [Clostridia bacterium]|nr:GNAT family N-acetyltransferase [Clostridia bacterium]
MDKIKLRIVSEEDSDFLFSIMNTDVILDALNEIPTQLENWKSAVKAWDSDDDEEDYIISDGENPIGWIAINGLSAIDNIVYIKMVAILPEFQNQGIGNYVITQVIEMLRKRNYSKIILYTDQDNHRAVVCYNKCGFKIAEKFKAKMSNGKTVIRHKMELTLDNKSTPTD